MEDDARPTQLSHWPFYCASVVLALLGAIFYFVAYTWDSPQYPSWQLLAVIALLETVAALLFVAPALIEFRAAWPERAFDVLGRLNAQLTDAEAAVRSYTKARMAVEALREAAQSQATGAQTALAQLQEELGSAKEQRLVLIEQRQEVERRGHELDEWGTSAINYLDYLQRIATQCKEADGGESLAELILSASDTFCKYALARGLLRLAPQPGEPMIGELCQAVKSKVSEYPEGHIVECTRWGYKWQDTVVRKAEVAVSTNNQVSQ